MKICLFYLIGKQILFLLKNSEIPFQNVEVFKCHFLLGFAFILSFNCSNFKISFF